VFRDDAPPPSSPVPLRFWIAAVLSGLAVCALAAVQIVNGVLWTHLLQSWADATTVPAPRTYNTSAHRLRTVRPHVGLPLQPAPLYGATAAAYTTVTSARAFCRAAGIHPRRPCATDRAAGASCHPGAAAAWPS
jgi:hypothetical protein